MSLDDMISSTVDRNFTPPAPEPPPDPVVEAPVDEGGMPEDVLARIAPSREDAPPPQPVEDNTLAEALAMESAPDSKNQKANQYWKAVKQAAAERDELAKKIDELSRQKPGEDLTRRITELEEEKSRMEEKLGQYDIQNTAAFQRDYNMPIQADLTKATRLLVQHGGKEQKDAEAIVARAIRMPFADRQRLLMDEAPDLAAVVSTILLETDSKLAAREEAIKNHKATKAALQETEIRQGQVQSVKMVEDNVSKAVEEAIATGNVYYTPSKSEKDPRSKVWNEHVESLKVQAKQTMLRAKPDEIARYVVEGLTARKLREDLSKMQAALEDERKLNKELKSARPGVSSSDVTARPRDDGKPKSMDELLNAAVAKGGFR